MRVHISSTWDDLYNGLRVVLPNQKAVIVPVNWETLNDGIKIDLFGTAVFVPLDWDALHEGVYVDVPEHLVPKLLSLTNILNSKVTIYNDVPADAVNARRFDRFVIDKCSIQGGIVSKADGTIENIVNAVTVITRDVNHYKQPLEYAKLPVDMKEDFYTVQVGDFVVLAEVDDVVTTSREFAELQTKYADNGIVVRSVSASIHGMSVDNITMANVG